jgi:hypothetical protein
MNGETTMNHPHTSTKTGFRQFDGSTFGELQSTEYSFDGAESDVADFAEHELCGDSVTVEAVKSRGAGTFDVLLSDGSDFRVYTSED